MCSGSGIVLTVAHLSVAGSLFWSQHLLSAQVKLAGVRSSLNHGSSQVCLSLASTSGGYLEPSEQACGSHACHAVREPKPPCQAIHILCTWYCYPLIAVRPLRRSEGSQWSFRVLGVGLRRRMMMGDANRRRSMSRNSFGGISPKFSLADHPDRLLCPSAARQ